MAISLRASAPFASGSSSIFPSCSDTDSISSRGANSSLSLRIHPAAGLRPQRRRLVGPVRAEQGNSQGKEAEGGSSGKVSLPTLPEWAKWAFAGFVWLGSVPAWNKVRDVGGLLERVDAVVERVEDLAEKADHIAEEIAKDLPDGDLKNVVNRIEKASEEVGAKAKVLDDILDKTNEVVRDLYYSAKGKGKGADGQEKANNVPARME